MWEKKSKKYSIIIILERNEIYAKAEKEEMKNKAENRGDPER